jgi:hypothetical protein
MGFVPSIAGIILFIKKDGIYMPSQFHISFGFTVSGTSTPPWQAWAVYPP